VLPDPELIKLGWRCKCPRCREGTLYRPGLTLTLKDKCETCGLDLGKNDSADGPAVFLIFILGFALVPMALLLEVWAQPPLWLHGVIWSVLALGITLGALRPLKAYIIALQFRHRPGDWQ
jgi:uncharacterized protein (DUF983 family)